MGVPKYYVKRSGWVGSSTRLLKEIFCSFGALPYASDTFAVLCYYIKTN